MIKVLFVAHDLGGYDAVAPVYKKMRTMDGIECKMVLLGPAAKKDSQYSINKDVFSQVVSDYFSVVQEGILITGTSWGDNSEISAIKMCREKGIKTVSILDYWSNYAARFLQSDGSYVYPDYYFVMDEIAKEQAIKEGVPSSIINITGQPGLDQYIMDCVPHVHNNKVLFLSQPLSSIYGEKLGYTEFSTTEDVIQLCKEKGMTLAVKFHPKETQQYREKYSVFKVDGSMKEFAAEYGSIIGMSSMGLLQCVLMGGTVISYQPNLRGTDLCITNQLGITKGAFSYEELKERIEDVKQQRLILNSLPWMDGKSIERCINQLLQIVKWI